MAVEEPQGTTTPPEQQNADVSTPADTSQQQTQEPLEPTGAAQLADDDHEPGGEDPQAVRARKEYRQRKRLQEELRQREVEQARLQARLEVLEQQAQQQQQPPQKVYTAEELQTYVDAGQLTHTQAAAYLAKIEAQRETRRALQEREQQEARNRPRQAAVQEIAQYKELVPWLSDTTNENFRPVVAEYQRLVHVYGLPPNEVTELLALKNTVGSLDTLRSKREIRNSTAAGLQLHAATPGGGSGSNSGRVDISKAPADLVEFWNKTNTPQKQREEEFKTYTETKAARSERFARFTGR